MHFDSFQFVDRIVELKLADRVIRTEGRLPLTHTIFEGHFPRYPLMPGVLLVEAMAQSGLWLVIAVTGFQRMPYLAAVKDAKLRSFVTPGQLLSLSAQLIHEGSGYAVVRASGTVEGKPVCSVEMTYRVMDFPNPELRAGMHERARRIEFPLSALVDG